MTIANGRHTRILGIAGYVPPRIWTNDDLGTLMDTSDEWIQKRTGIKQRHWVEQDSDTGTSDLALEASRAALEAAGVEKQDLGMILLATQTPDHDVPGTACFLQEKLGVPGIPAIDLRQQCPGFLVALSMADHFIRAGNYRKILVIGTEIHSKVADKSTRGRDLAVLFGDGAGAAVVGSEEGPIGPHTSRVVSCHLHSDGRYAKDLWIPDPGTAHPGDCLTMQRMEEGYHLARMNGKSIFMHAVKRSTEALAEALETNALTIDDIDLFVLHQANFWINDTIVKQLGIPPGKTFDTIDRLGNTGSASVPIGLAEAVRVGRLKRGMLVASVAFGSGFNWASAIIRW